jgi:hypothetical protein
VQADGVDADAEALRDVVAIGDALGQGEDVAVLGMLRDRGAQQRSVAVRVDRLHAAQHQPREEALPLQSNHLSSVVAVEGPVALVPERDEAAVDDAARKGEIDELVELDEARHDGLHRRMIGNGQRCGAVAWVGDALGADLAVRPPLLDGPLHQVAAGILHLLRRVRDRQSREAPVPGHPSRRPRSRCG